VLTACLRRQWAAIAFASLVWAVMLALGFSEGGDGANLVQRDKAVVSGSLWWEIFSGNSRIALGLFSGVVCLGLTTLLLTATSATILGAMTAQVIHLFGWGEFAVRVGPHLIPEMGGFVLATAAGMTSLVALVRRIGGWSERLAFGQVLRDALTLQLLAFPALLLAATIETWVSA